MPIIAPLSLAPPCPRYIIAELQTRGWTLTKPKRKLSGISREKGYGRKKNAQFIQKSRGFEKKKRGFKKTRLNVSQSSIVFLFRRYAYDGESGRALENWRPAD
jgi:hypothetical protein